MLAPDARPDGDRPIDLKLQNATGSCALYVAADGSTFYYLMLNVTGQPPPTTTALAAWASPGSYVWAQQPITGSATDLAGLLGLTTGPNATNALAWLTGGATPAAVVLPVNTGGSPNSGQVSAPTTLPFGNLGLQVPVQTGLLIDDNQVSVLPNQVSLVRGSMGSGYLVPDANLTIAFGGPAAGALCGTAGGWDSYTLFQLVGDNPYDSGPARAGDLRYFQPASAGLYTQFAYPTMPAVSNDGTQPSLSFDLQFHPGAPYDGTRTRLLFAVGSDVSALASSYSAAVTGQPVTLTPLSTSAEIRAGFYFAQRGPTDSSQGSGPLVYLAPLGSFGLTVSGSANRMLCGLNSLEFVTTATGDRLALVPSQPALAPGGNQDTPALTAQFSTSWVDLSGLAGEYFGQPAASVNFGTGVVPKQASGSMTLPAAVTSKVRPLAGSTPVPLVFYGGVGQLAGPTPDQLRALENGVLAPTRGARLRTTTSARHALEAPAPPPDPVFGDAAGNPMSGRTSTPQGFVVALNVGPPSGRAARARKAAADDPGPPRAPVPPKGTWQQVQLARSGAQLLAFDATANGTVAPWLATTLLQDQLFFVLTDWQQFPMAERLLTVAGFNFELAPDADSPDPADTVLVFKYNTAKTLTELIDDGDWTHADVFIGDQAKVQAAQAVLQNALKVAQQSKGKPDDPFIYFRDVVASQPGWTGLLSFNGPINGNGMPADLQMLFAGIDGQLRAHHFGVELNRVVRDDPAGPAIAESSLFGAIHYEQPAPPVSGDYGFAVEELNVALASSAVTDFHAKVAVTINTLFGRSVSLAPQSEPANTLRLAGRYQKHGDVGTVTFDQPEQAGFSFAGPPRTVRVLDQLQVSTATLAPVASDKPQLDLTGTQGDSGSSDSGPGGPTSEIHARISLGGGLSFLADPFPGVQGLDLFSYGNQGQGIGISGVAMDLTCQLDADGKRTGPPTITADLSATVLADNPDGKRAGSLVSLLPLTLDRFLQNPTDGLSAKELGAVPLNVVELAPSSNPPADQAQQQSRLTNAPHYALRFRLPLGSLGSLADVHASLDAWLVLGWGPSSYTPDNDGAGIFVQLPTLSAGALGFNLEGLLKTTFGDANLMRVALPSGAVYVVLFNNVALSFFGLKFPPRVITDLILFAGGSGAQSLGWSLAATQVSQSSNELDQPLFRELA